VDTPNRTRDTCRSGARITTPTRRCPAESKPVGPGSDGDVRSVLQHAGPRSGSRRIPRRPRFRYLADAARVFEVSRPAKSPAHIALATAPVEPRRTVRVLIGAVAVRVARHTELGQNSDPIMAFSTAEDDQIITRRFFSRQRRTGNSGRSIPLRKTRWDGRSSPPIPHEPIVAWRGDYRAFSQGCWREPPAASTLTSCVPPAPRLDRQGLHIGGANDQFE
jgi:hypothetical protein